MATYRVLCPASWTAQYAPDEPPHKFGIEFYSSVAGENRRYEEGDLIEDLPIVADHRALIAMGYIEEVGDPRVVAKDAEEVSDGG